jgi:hypothetical protein
MVDARVVGDIKRAKPKSETLIVRECGSLDEKSKFSGFISLWMIPNL